ncbi:MAG: TIR domain-containing protein [Anaerolineae bacterium]|nr:TIR domain-containing protein [Anaerolineae bacterium]
MSEPRAFISFDFDHDEDQKVLFAGQSKNSSTPFTIQDWSAKEAMAQSRWEAIVEDKMKRSNMVIVLVGKYMASATGVSKEIEMAVRNNVPMFGVYISGANSLSNLPNGLARNRVIGWTWDGISKAVAQMMNEGKNR